MEYTEHFHMNKPEKTDFVDIDKISENFQTIDDPLYNGQTASEVVSDMVNPDAETHPEIIVRGITVLDEALFPAGSGVTFTPSSKLIISPSTPELSEGKVLGSDEEGRARPSDVAIGDIKSNSEFIDSLHTPTYVGNRPDIFAAGVSAGNVGVTGSVNVASGGSLNIARAATLNLDPDTTENDVGVILIMTSSGRIQPSGVKVKNPNSGYWIDNAASILKAGEPALYNTNAGTVTPNTNVSAMLLGICENDPVNAECRIITSGKCKILVYKDPNKTYQPTFGMTGRGYSAVESFGGFVPATTNTDLGGFSGNVKRPKITLENPNDYANMTDETTALLDAYICVQ